MVSPTAYSQPKTSKTRKWLRRTAFTFLGLIGLVLLIFVGALAYVSTSAGGERLRRLVVEKTNASIQGTLALDSLSLHGGHLVLRGVELKDPEGEPVAKVATVEVRVALGQLVHKRVDVRVVRLEHPELTLLQDEDGLNLQRAIAAKTPKAPTPPSGSQKSSLGFILESLDLVEGTVDFVQSSAAGERHVHLEGLNAHGSAKVLGEALAADLKASGDFSEPLEAALSLSLSAKGAGERREAQLSLQLGDAVLTANAAMVDATHLKATLESLEIPPEVARAFVPTYPLKARARLSGAAEREGDVARGHLRAEAAAATVRVDGSLNLASHLASGVTVTMRHVDLSELVARGPASNIALDAQASGGGTSLRDLQGEVELSVPPSHMESEPMGPVHVAASARQGTLHLAELLMVLPGVRLNAQGQVSSEQVALTGKLVASDLAAFSRTLGRLVGPKGLALKGQGELAFAAGGTLEHPRLNATANFPALVFQTTRVNGLALQASVPDLKVSAGLHVSVLAQRVSLAPKRNLREVQLKADGDGNDLHVDAGVHGDAELALTALASLDPGGQGGTLKSLSLRYPEASWSLAAPVRLQSGPHLLSMSPLKLASGEQSISLKLLKRGRKLSASAALHAFDLGRLPKAFVDPAFRLGGVLNLTARVDGSAQRPDIVAQVVLQKGRFRKYSDVAFHLEASYVKEHARGKVDANGEGVHLSGHFDVPVKALRKGHHEPLDVDLQIAELQLDESLRDLGIDKPIQGKASAKLTLKGTADDPKLHLAVRGEGLQFQKLPPADLQVSLRSAAQDSNHLEARANFEQERRKSSLELRTPFTLGRLLRRIPTKRELMKAVFALKADIAELPLKMLSDAGLSARPLDGSLSAKADLQGSAATLHGQLRVEGKKVSTQGVRPVDLLVTLLASRDLRLTAKADQIGHPLLRVKARLEATAEQLQGKALASAPFSIVADLGPLSLSEFQEATQATDMDPVDAPPRIQGNLSAHVSASGSLHAPVAQVHAALSEFGAVGSPTGNVTLEASYARAKEAVDLLLKSTNGGQLHLVASAARELSYPPPAQAKPVTLTPLSATLQAKDFDVAFLSNLSSAVEQLGGLVQADARFDGTLRSPQVNGKLEWLNGLLYTHGNGDFTQVHVLASGDNNRLELKDLSAKSGRGSAKLYALATRTAGKDFQLHAKADLSKFPAMSDGQLMATITLRSTADGNANPSLVNIRRLAIPEAHIQLPDVQRKDLQKLQPPEDVVLTMRGKPIKGSKAKRSATAEAGVGGSGNAGMVAATPAPNPLQVHVLVEAPRNLWIQGNDINTEFGLSDGFRVEYAAAPQVFGDVNVLRGRMDVFGRRFDFQKESKVSFSGPPMEPELNVTAEYKNETEQVRVYLKVQGQKDKLALQPTSDPPLPETEIYTLLATGHTSLRHGTGKTSPSGEAASFVGSLAASQLKKTLSSKLPLDVLSIEAGDNGLSGTKLEAGTYVNDRFYVGFTGRIGADPMRGENSNEVDLEYQLSKYWSVNGDYGDARAGGASVNWRRDY